MRAALLACALLTASTSTAQTSTVKGTVVVKQSSALLQGSSGNTPAVVYVADFDEPPPKRAAALPRMSQRDKTFDPQLLVVQKGSHVTFPNEDKVFHNVFSLSKGNQFDLGIYRQGESRTVAFTRAGTVDVFCNIHPQMVASILVVPNRHFAIVDDKGGYTLRLPPGKRKIIAWWPKGAPVEREIEVSPGGEVKLDFELLDSGRLNRHTNKEGLPYGRYK